MLVWKPVTRPLRVTLDVFDNLAGKQQGALCLDLDKASGGHRWADNVATGLHFILIRFNANTVNMPAEISACGGALEKPLYYLLTP
jgi:hypothetical protein